RDRGDGVGVLIWDDALAGGAVQVRYRIDNTLNHDNTPGNNTAWSAWTAATAYGSGYSFDYGALSASDQSYEFEIQSINGSTPYRFTYGTVALIHSGAGASAVLTSNLQTLTGFTDLGGSVFGWSTQANAGDTVLFKYRQSGGST